MRLRPATPDDGALLHTLVLELATYERAPEAVEATPELFAAHLAAQPPPFSCVFAEIEGEVAGFTLFFPNYSTWRGKPGIWIEELYVRPAFRGQGVARALVGEVARRAIAAGCGRIDFSVLDWNELAHGFYRRLGARPLGDWTQWRIEEAGFGVG
ncbi:MAG: GNAT family N-acetyltransferase [Pseudomonadota bacterium]